MSGALKTDLKSGIVLVQEELRLLDYLPEPVMVSGFDQKVLWTNQAFQTKFTADLVGRFIPDVFQDMVFCDAVAESIYQKKPQEVIFKSKEFVHLTFRANIQPILDQNLVMVALYDISEIERTEKMRVDFIANASHELKTPLSTFVGFIETLQGPAREDEQARDTFLQIMKEQADHMERLVEDLMSLSRIEQRQHTMPGDAVNIPELLEATASLLTPKAADRNIKIKIKCTSDLPWALGDQAELSLALNNLVSNAIRYGHADSIITLSADFVQNPVDDIYNKKNGAIQIAVQDQGDGIAPEHIPRLTERFYCVDQARSRKVGGTGLGLAIVKHTVKRHRGALDIKSVEGKGSTFTVYLPCA